MTNAVHYPMVSIEFERETIPIETMTPTKMPDEKWRHVDKQGHGHFWKGDDLPTLEWVVTGTAWVGDEYDGDEIEVGEYRCRLCAETVEPKKRAEYGPRYIPGLTTFTVTIDGEQFRLTDQQYADSVAAWTTILRETT